MPIPSSSLPYLPHSSRVSGTHSWIGWRWAVRCALGGIELPSVSASSFQCFITPRLSASSVESHKDLQTHYRQRSLVPSHSFPLSGISPQLQKGRSFTNVFSASTHTLSLSYTQKKRKDYITSYLMDFVKPLVAGLSFIRSGIEDRQSSCQTVPILHRTFRKCIYLPLPLPSSYVPGGSIKKDIYSVCS